MLSHTRHPPGGEYPDPAGLALLVLAGHATWIAASVLSLITNVFAMVVAIIRNHRRRDRQSVRAVEMTRASAPRS